MSGPLVLVTGANGLVGAHACAALRERGGRVRALVRRPGTAPAGTEETVGEFSDPQVAAAAVAGVDVVVTTVHPMGAGLETQRRIGVDGTTTVARAAAAAGVGRLVHVSSTAVYDRRPHVGDVDEGAALVPDDAGAYAVTKRDADLALAGVEGLTRVLVRPSAILGAGASSVWNTLRPERMRDGAAARRTNPVASWPWVHVTDLAVLLADIATGGVPMAEDPADGVVDGGCTAVNAATGTASQGEYWTAVTQLLGRTPIWDAEPVWTGRIDAGRAHAWGWAPRVDLAVALAEIQSGVRRGTPKEPAIRPV